MNVNILVVDDEEEIRTMLSRHLRYQGFEVTLAENGVEALKRLAEKKTDIVISDILMPEMTGVELLKKIRLDFPMTRSIMITGHVTLDHALACIRYGADACVFKPITDMTLLDNAVRDSVARIKYWFDILKELRGLKDN